MSSARAALVEHQVPLGGMSIRNPQRIDRPRLVGLRRHRHVTVVLGITVAFSVVLVLAPVTAWLLGRDAPDTLIGTFPDALWWAMETISTVGYNGSRRLLIKTCGWLREFDGEQGLDAGVQVEGFTGPAGSDGSGVGMLEAVHRS